MDDTLGKSPGALDVQTIDPNISNSYPTISDHDLEAESDRVNPNQVTTGTTRGTQTYPNLDGSYMTLGLIPDGGTDFGIAFFDKTGTLITKITQETQYVYDKTSGVNIMQIGKLPDGTYGMVVAKPGIDVADLFTSS